MENNKKFNDESQNSKLVKVKVDVGMSYIVQFSGVICVITDPNNCPSRAQAHPENHLYIFKICAFSVDTIALVN